MLINVVVGLKKSDIRAKQYKKVSTSEVSEKKNRIFTIRHLPLFWMYKYRSIQCLEPLYHLLTMLLTCNAKKEPLHHHTVHNILYKGTSQSVISLITFIHTLSLTLAHSTHIKAEYAETGKWEVDIQS